MLAGYACVSARDQNPELQLDAFGAAGWGRVFEDRASGARSDRQGPRKEGRASEQTDAGAAPLGRGDAEGQEGLFLRQRRDPQPLDRPNGLLSLLPEGADPGTQGLRQERGR